ncbi:PREDICTED: uncharacterized protein LOC18589236 [Theobroma cacao]|uniref:Uncharacterized protein LOC18589236 n=1 Tax=Theobroma cacao TaxID=3641 RepID=A0AB32UR77_THECC|nr:PREDICTED: uncharacterized protein LOC18589236 [Theobroma cacao]
MATTTTVSHLALPLFNGDNYPSWSVKMKAYLRGYDLWDVIESGSEVPPLRDNASAAQIKQYHEETTKRYRALSFIHGVVTEPIFSRIMACKSAKEAWEKLKVAFQGSDRTRHQQVMNLMREFEALKMKDTDSVKDYINKVEKIVHQVTILGRKSPEDRVVEKVIISLPERFESKISSLEEAKDLSKITLTELVNALQAVENKRAIRNDENVEHALIAKMKGKSHGESFANKVTSEQKDKEKRSPPAGKQQYRRNRNV